MTPRGTDQAQLRDALHRLTPEERNFLVLYQRGGASNVVRELGGKHEDVEAWLAAIRERVGAVHAQELAAAAARDESEPPKAVVHSARSAAPEAPSVNGALHTVRADEPTDTAEADEPPAPAEAAPTTPVGLDRRADSPIIDAMRSLGRPTTVPELAKVLDRIPGNVATRMRQLERENPPRPATTVNGDPRISEPGHHDSNVSGSQQANAVRVSVHEAAALQGFPPDWPWWACRSQTAAFTCIGNAIPPLMARRILRAVRGDPTDDRTEPA